MEKIKSVFGGFGTLLEHDQARGAPSGPEWSGEGQDFEYDSPDQHDYRQALGGAVDSARGIKKF